MSETHTETVKEHAPASADSHPHGAAHGPASPGTDAGPGAGGLSLPERIYVVEVVRGLAITLGHLFRNLLFPGRFRTIQWPELPRPLPQRFRAKHRLNKWEDGHTKCTACMCCATACPAGCITIVAGEFSKPLVKVDAGVTKIIEKYPTLYDIDLLKCVYCGFCVEACPCDAIKMDTGKFPRAGYSREDFLWQNRFKDGLPTLERNAAEA
ncbi:MAG: NADH-quinone oxidoreductase subunit I [Planctomycetes bacterium]|nr:NADH-quinone oxidoreductase subunit I [Planctomycetota bacterium]